MQQATDDKRFIIATAVVFAGIVLLACEDILSDVREGTSGLHLLVEAGVVLFGACGVWLMASRLVATMKLARGFRSEADTLKQRLKSTQDEAERWKRETGDLLAGLGTAIDSQFSRWDLSPAEREVALLLLKGLSHKEIAQLRAVGEATVRQQAQAVYRKGGVSGRHDLAAFFLEDLLLPPGTAT